MRLLNVNDLQLVDFQGQDIPRYAILSHTWGEDEVTFEDLSKNNYRHKHGFSKIEGCRKLTKHDRLEWFWVDTCCIDKSSSAELSEAINSMYAWYQRAEYCYVYLVDVPTVPYPGPFDSLAFQNSRWFTRGWTLQELLAPTFLIFYDASWGLISYRCSSVDLISEITGIDANILESPYRIKEASIALKLSWASQRQTSREEDMAYCLMGLLDVNMPLLYGEGGARAFHRLQKELMNDQYDHTILAWGLCSKKSLLYRLDDIHLLAPSPAFFGKWNVHMRHISPESTHYFLTNLGLHISLPIIFLGEKYALGLLECKDETDSYRVALPLYINHHEGALPIGKKVRNISPLMVPPSARQHAHLTTIYLQGCQKEWFGVLSTNVVWSTLLINGYKLADYFPPSEKDRVSSSSGEFRGVYGSFLLRFRHKYLDDILIMGRQRPNDIGSLIKNGIRIFEGYAAIATFPNPGKQEGKQQSRPLTSWELLSQPDFDKIDFERIEKSFQWSSSVTIVLNHLEDLGTGCNRKARFILSRSGGDQPHQHTLSVEPAPILETNSRDSSSKPSH
ncbi:HET-domain-containing protein [Annulohypoxylon truncatum]|uniref:HET-domain-containing protein n=1 Tax=Annulohypoxylon truncatum TaxID=327061 RepID=UPI0020073B06|nr:HET-domain-containing protein [Annulohypoxylon truncatum]KAI1209660.1 HET-domain-containing protein [Annulohypoxylon truncatum]